MGFVQRRLVKLVMRVVCRPWLTVGVCAVLLVAAVGFAKLHLSLSTDENALLTPNLPFFKDYLRYDSQFPENESFVVIVEPKDYAHPPPAARWMALADKITANLRALKNDVKRVDTRIPLDELGPQSLEFAPWPKIESASKDMQEFSQLIKIIAEKPNLADSLVLGSNMTQRLFNALARDPRASSLAGEVLRTLNNALQKPVAAWNPDDVAINFSSLEADAATNPEAFGYTMIPDESKRHDPAHKNDKILIINVHQSRDYSSLADVTEPLKRMRAAVADAAQGFDDFIPPVITGRPALEADEMATSDRDTKIAEICGLSLVFVAMFLFLRHLWLVIVAEITLGVGIGWTFGWASLSVGRLNLLSLVFVIALIGIGMDYLIQILSRYRFEKKRYTRPQAIWARVFRYVSPPISTACAGAGGAFLVSALTQFKGAAELGIIAGGGLLLCLAAGYTLLPAILTILPANVGRVDEADRYHDPEIVKRRGWRGLIVPGAWCLIAAAGLFVSLPPKFDPNLLRLQAQSLPSVQSVHKLPLWFAVVTADDLDTLRRARAAFAPADPAKSTIAGTESVLDAMDKQQWLASHNAALNNIAWQEPAPPDGAAMNNIANAATAMTSRWAGQNPPIADLPALQSLSASIAATLKKSPDDADLRARVAAWQMGFLTSLRQQVAQFIPQGLNIPALPQQLREHLVSDRAPQEVTRSEQSATAATARQQSYTYALYIYPKDDLWESGALERFVAEVEARTPPGVTLTGIAPQLYHSVQEIRKAFRNSTLYALALIIILVFLDLRKFGQTLLAISVLALGLPMLLLIMWLWQNFHFGSSGTLEDLSGIPGSWNFANFFGLPILIGAGHEYGVFMVHRYRETLHDPRRVWKPWDVSDRALLLCAIVTSFSFGFLMLANHNGLKSLGWVMAVGTACIYLASLLVLRPILHWRLHRKRVYGSKRPPL